MEFKSSEKRKSLNDSKILSAKKNVEAEVPTLYYYSVPPKGSIDLSQAQDLIEERLNILSIFDDMKVDPAFSKLSSDYFTTLKNRVMEAKSKFGMNFVKASQLTRSENSAEKINARNRDIISHFLLRLYYCRNDELKNWLVDRETDLLKFRLMSVNTNEITKLIESNGLDFEKVAEDDKPKFEKEVNFNGFEKNFHIYKVAFEQALYLIRTRRVYLEKGFAYIMTSDMIILLCQRFRLELSICLGNLRRVLPIFEEDKRILPGIHSCHIKLNLAKKLISKSSGETKDSITAEMVEDLSKQFYPPCMDVIHQSLRKNHHLKHYARVHYGLFLKSIGLGLDEAMKLFREEFIQIMPPEKFDRQYKYGIRYNYGKEGKKVSFSAYSCSRIINGDPPGPGDVHGCPFRNMQGNNLITMLKRKGIEEEKITEILTKVESKNYTNACKIYFCSKHPDSPVPVDDIYHPNQFYNEARKFNHLVIKAEEENEEKMEVEERG